MQNDGKLTHRSSTAPEIRRKVANHTVLMVLIASIIHLIITPAIAANATHPALKATFHPIADIRGTAEQFAMSLGAEWDLINPKITVSPLDHRLRLKACQRALTADAELRQQIRNQHMSVAIRCTAPEWKLYVPVKIESDSATVTLKRALPRGSTITEHDLQLTFQRTRPGNTPMISAVADAIGLELTRDLSSGTILMTSHLRKPYLVKRGDLVNVQVDRNGLRVTTLGEARQDGTEGQMIPIKNPRSNRIIEGKIQPDGSITVM